jgi:ankyrin repeat protein/WD40 repeat protein
MNLKKVTQSIWFGLVFLYVIGDFQISAQRVTRNDEWVFTNSYGVPVWIAYNDGPGPPAIFRRDIFIFIETANFTPENIKKLFTNLAAEFKEPKWMSVTVFDDKKMLQRAIDSSTSGVSIHWADTPEGREAAKKWSQEHDPLPSGYNRARYSRMQRNNYSQWYVEEEYSYSPDPAKPEMVKVVLQKPPKPSPYTGDLNADLLIAAYEGDAEKVRSLLSQGANANARDKDRNTALMKASLSGRDLEIVKLLLEKGADVNAKNKDGSTALIYAASNKKAEILQTLLDQGAAVNHQDNTGYSALIMASVSNYRLANFKVLVERSADLELKTEDGDTALSRSVESGDAEMVKLLLQKGAKTNGLYDEENTLLMKASANGNLEIIRMILAKTTNVNAKNSDGETALMFARNKEATLALLAKGADVNAKDKEGNTVLMKAAQQRGLEKVQVLLENGADIKAKNHQGETALNLAKNQYGVNNQLLDLLEEAEARTSESASDEAASMNAGGKVQPELVVKRDPLAQCCEEVSSVAFSPDGKVITAKLYHSKFAGKHGLILWDTTTGRFLKSIEGPQNGVYSVRFKPNGKEIVSEYGKSWDIETEKPLQKDGASENAADENRVYSTAFSGDGRVVATSERKIGERSKLTIRDTSTGTEIRSFFTESEVTQLLLNIDGKMLVGVFRASKTIVIWDVTTGEELQKIKSAGPGFFAMACSNDGKRLAFCAGDLSKELPVMVFDTSTGKLIYKLDDDAIGVHSLAFSPDNRLLASGSSGAKVRLWDAASGKLLRTMEGHTQLVRQVAFSPDGRLIVSGGGKNETKIWSVKTGDLLVTLQTFNDGNWIAYTPDGYYNCSAEAVKYITWRIGKKVSTEVTYKAQYFKPEILAERLRD